MTWKLPECIRPQPAPFPPWVSANLPISKEIQGREANPQVLSPACGAVTDPCLSNCLVLQGGFREAGLTEADGEEKSLLTTKPGLPGRPGGPDTEKSL